MIEITVLEYLTSELSDIDILMEEPENPDASYVVMRKTGSDVENQIREATFAILSYGATLYEAAALNARVVAAMESAQPADGMFAAVLNSDYEYTNTGTKQYRYQAIFEVYY